MEFDGITAIWFALLVLIAMAAWRLIAGIMAASDTLAVAKIGTGLGAIVG
jgi:hypothetical protein